MKKERERERVGGRAGEFGVLTLSFRLSPFFLYVLVLVPSMFRGDTLGGMDTGLGTLSGLVQRCHVSPCDGW